MEATVTRVFPITVASHHAGENGWVEYDLHLDQTLQDVGLAGDDDSPSTGFLAELLNQGAWNLQAKPEGNRLSFTLRPGFRLDKLYKMVADQIRCQMGDDVRVSFDHYCPNCGNHPLTEL